MACIMPRPYQALDAAPSLRIGRADLQAIFRSLQQIFRLACHVLRGQRGEVEQEICVRELVQTLGLLQSLVCHHLAVLTRAGLVRSRRHRGFTLYALDGEAMARARLALGRLLDPDTLVPAARPGGNPDCCLVGRPAQARAAG